MALNVAKEVATLERMSVSILQTRKAKGNEMKKETPARERKCAIYTRKSAEEGLKQKFNTLDAQRESAECYASESNTNYEPAVASYRHSRAAIAT